MLGKGGVSVETITSGDILSFHNLPLMILTCKSAHSSLSPEIRHSPYPEVTNGDERFIHIRILQLKYITALPFECKIWKNLK